MDKTERGERGGGKRERKRENCIPPVQRVPVYPSGQMHSKLPSRFLQVPPFRQGNCMHSLKSAKNQDLLIKNLYYCLLPAHL